MPDGLVVRPIGTRHDRRSASGRPRARRSATTATRRSGPRRTGRRSRATSRTCSTWVIAFDGDEIAGGIWNRIDPAENAHHGRRTRRPRRPSGRGARWRRRGLAKALIARSLVALRDRGMTSAALDVDGANPNQAMSLYLGQGFEITTSCDRLAKAAADATASERTTGVTMTTITQIPATVEATSPISA